MIKAVFFDFFGVLYPNTFWRLADIFRPERGVAKQQSWHDLLRQVDLGLIDKEDFWDQAAAEFGTTKDELMKAKDELGGVDQNLLKLIGDLKKNGRKTGIISNVGVGFVEQAISKEIRDNYFDTVVLSSSEGVVKPSKEIFQIAARQLGLELDECLFFDDILRNVDGARKAGMHAEVYTGIAACRASINRSIPNMYY